jgi:hypothetical protein
MFCFRCAFAMKPKYRTRMKAIRQHMKKEAPEKLDRLEPHALHAV